MQTGPRGGQLRTWAASATVITLVHRCVAMTKAAAGELARVVASAASGDEVAFARIVAACNGEMYRVCVVVARDRTIAEEAVQAAWLIAWRKLGKVREPERVRPMSGVHQSGGIPGFLEVKDPSRSDQSEVKGLLWRSDDDGVSWTPLDLPIQLQPGEAIFPRAIAWTPSGFVLALGSFGHPGSVWHSEDGLSWEQVADTGEAWVESFAVDGQRVVAFTGPGVVLDDEEQPIWADQPTPVLQSADGRTWSESLEAALDVDIVDPATVSSEGRIVALGRHLEPGMPLFGPSGPISFPTLVWVSDPS